MYFLTSNLSFLFCLLNSPLSFPVTKPFVDLQKGFLIMRLPGLYLEFWFQWLQSLPIIKQTLEVPFLQYCSFVYPSICKHLIPSQGLTHWLPQFTHSLLECQLLLQETYLELWFILWSSTLRPMSFRNDKTFLEYQLWL